MRQWIDKFDAKDREAYRIWRRGMLVAYCILLFTLMCGLLYAQSAGVRLQPAANVPAAEGEPSAAVEPGEMLKSQPRASCRRRSAPQIALLTS